MATGDILTSHVAQLTIRPGSARAWLLAARPATLTAAFVPVAVGTACAIAAGGFRAVPALAALLGAMLIQIGTNFANDLYDFKKGADNEDRKGPTRAALAGLLTPADLKAGMIVVFGTAVLIGSYLVWIAGWPIVLIGLASIASGIAYTAGPYPLGYHGLGDVFVLGFFGFVAVCGTTFVQLGEVSALSIWAAVPIGAIATAILVINNLRDRETDSLTGKRTLAVRLGATAVRIEYVLLLLAAYAVPVWLAVDGVSAWALLPLLTLPLAAAQTRVAWSTEDGPTLNVCLQRTAMLLLAYGVLFALGIGLGAA